MKLFSLTLILLIWQLSSAQDSSKTYLFVGSYTYGEKTDGIYVYQFNTTTGKLDKVETEGGLINPSFITLSPNGQYLYACTETKLDKEGSISSFEIDSLSGKLSFINKQKSGGRNPVHLAINVTGEYLINSNYTDAGISIFKCNINGSIAPYSQLIQFNGSSIIQGRQDDAHIHSCTFSPNNDYIFAPDLGSDKIRILHLDSFRTLIPLDSLDVALKNGSGPRHFTFHPNNKYAFCINELSGTVSVYSFINGELIFINDYFSYSKQQETYGSSDIHISPDGRFLYASNRWNDENTISIFSINITNGTLLLVGHQKTFGDHPRSFVIDPTGSFLLVANQVTGNIVVFKINTETGLLTKYKTVVKVNLPSSLKMRSYQF
jgi:6-phosphogluconolactonase